MSVSTSVWKRIGHALRTNLSANGGDHSAITIQPIATKSTARPNGENGNGSSWHLPWQWGRGRMSKAEQRYQRVAELLTALREQFERQDRRAEQLARGVENIGVTLQQLAKTQQSQSASVGKIAERVDEAGKYTAGMSSMLLEMPASAAIAGRSDPRRRQGAGINARRRWQTGRFVATVQPRGGLAA